jgi:hypothetical protein
MEHFIKPSPSMQNAKRSSLDAFSLVSGEVTFTLLPFTAKPNHHLIPYEVNITTEGLNKNIEHSKLY